MNPAQLKYSPTHEWVHVDGDVATIGISDFAVAQLTDLVYIDLPAAGRKIKAGETFGEVESVKAVSDLYAPVSGEIIAANTALADDLQQLSDDPFGAGWIIKLRITDPAGLDKLLNQTDYRRHCESEAH
jgi:glycine cleavage system H protein